MNLLSEIDAFAGLADLVLEGVTEGFFFHGTSAKNASGILDTGMKPAGGTGWGSASVYVDKLDKLYLTGQFGKAARYAVKFDAPVVLGIKITKSKRLAKLNTDPADERDSVMYDGGMTEPPPNPLSDLAHQLDKFAKKRRWGRDVFTRYRDGLFPVEVDDIQSAEPKLRKFNLYRTVKSFLQDKFDKSRADNEYTNFLRNFRPGEYEGIHIRNNGSLRFDASYWEDQHQLEYPDALPPAAVKEVWVLASALREAGIRPDETRTTELSRLPGEQKYILESTKDLGRELAEFISEIEEPSEISEAEQMLEEHAEEVLINTDEDAVEKVKEIMEPFYELIDEMKNDPDLEMNMDEYAMAAKSAAFGVEDYVYDLWHDPYFGSTDREFGLVDPSALRRIR